MLAARNFVDKGVLHLFRSKPSHLRLARYTEAYAIAHLERAGLQLIARNYRCKAGEIDAIFINGMQIVVVEVRSRIHRQRQTRQFASADMRSNLVSKASPNLQKPRASFTVDQKKKRRIIKTFDHFLMKHPAHKHRTRRFDIVSIDLYDKTLSNASGSCELANGIPTDAKTLDHDIKVKRGASKPHAEGEMRGKSMILKPFSDFARSIKHLVKYRFKGIPHADIEELELTWHEGAF